MTEICSLCKQNRNLQESHIIPKFIGKWLKEVSATGFLTNASNASKRVQDLPKRRLLCSGCEEIFSKFEKYFADEIFYPFHNKQNKLYKYDKRLRLFMISLSWRILKTHYDSFKSDYPQFSSVVDKAEKHWREFLIGSRQIINPYENHLIFSGYLKNGDGIYPKINAYTQLAIDVAIAFDEKKVYIYTKLPGMIFVSSIHPTTLKGWSGTGIKESGTISTSHLVADGEFGNFFLNRVKLAFNSSAGPSIKTSSIRVQKAVKKIHKNFMALTVFKL